ncbi:hypothetical protein LBW62_19175 [Ralstonia solanacearum]|uniref:hypothetical protein n=1 Tax=Ralstonia solanacearum TaxID=305 RepID=UPI000AB41677|nr:hypothetical protein [Ralstonia solanacearum]MDB0543329.1 hypothetical protein [Ralstonia solanacearum]MDB0553461.1 hypothetical protein [Ralstonia solanacearum]MDB0558308.1 hypothetical protein [Ralstonia solanacearum]
MPFQQQVRTDLRTPSEVDEERAAAALREPSLSYAQVTAAAEQRIVDQANASVGGAVYKERAIGAYLLWYDLTRNTHSKADNARLSRLAGLTEPLR